MPRSMLAIKKNLEVSPVAIWFLATGKSGLGHLRRVATIAGAMRRLAAERRLVLLTNAPPQGLDHADLAVFDDIRLAERADMAAALPQGEKVVAVLDTIAVPGIENASAALALILREMPDTELSRFRLPGDRSWNQIIVANPAAHWLPSDATGPVEQVEAVGWIYRTPPAQTLPKRELPRVLVATGGGGTAQTAGPLYAAIDTIIAGARASGAHFEVVQAIGPRARSFGRLNGADRTIDPGGGLNALFGQADVVISTAGYNSVLELALTDTPSLLIPIPRSIDDQAARVQLWGPRLGAGHDEQRPAASAAWLARTVARSQRRSPVDLGVGGEDRAAALILSLA